MKPTPGNRNETSPAGSQYDALESLEARLWDRARRNLRLLYNGGRLTPGTATCTNVAVGPIAVNSKA